MGMKCNAKLFIIIIKGLCNNEKENNNSPTNAVCSLSYSNVVVNLEIGDPNYIEGTILSKYQLIVCFL